MFQNDPEYYGVVWNVPECSRTFSDYLECSGTSWNVLEHSAMFRSVPECSGMFWRVPGVGEGNWGPWGENPEGKGQGLGNSEIESEICELGWNSQIGRNSPRNNPQIENNCSLKNSQIGKKFPNWEKLPTKKFPKFREVPTQKFPNWEKFQPKFMNLDKIPKLKKNSSQKNSQTGRNSL